MSFRDFLLSEAIKPKEIKYGLNYPDFDDKKIHPLPLNVTFFTLKGLVYFVGIYENEVSFGVVAYNPNENVFWNIGTTITQRTQAGIGNTVFNCVFYVALRILKKTKETDIYFNGGDNHLDKFYMYLTKNKMFIKELKKLNWIYKYKKDENYHFKKEQNV